MNTSKHKLVEYKNHLREYFIDMAPDVNITELNELLEEFTIDTFTKKQMVITVGQSTDSIFFVCKGMVRIYYEKEGKEITNWFIREGMLFTATYAVLTGNTNLYNYEAIEDTVVIKMKYNTLLAYYKKYHSLEYLGRKMIEKYYVAYIKRSYDALYLSAEERFHQFKEVHGDLLNRVPLRYIASYIGVTQETLSRLRAKH